MHLSFATASCMGNDDWGNRSGLAGLTICTDKYSPINMYGEWEPLGFCMRFALRPSNKNSSGCNQKRTDQYVSSLIRRDHGRPFCVQPIANFVLTDRRSVW